MFRSVPTLLILGIAITIAACSTQKTPAKPIVPVALVRTATMNVTAGIQVLARIDLPEGFAPAAEYPPMWLRNGEEIGVVGERGGHTVVMGYLTNASHEARVLAEDNGVGAPDGG